MSAPTKPWYRSRMLWLNAIAAGLVALEYNLNLVQPYLPVNFYLAMVVLLPIINMILRVITSQPLTLREDHDAVGH